MNLRPVPLFGLGNVGKSVNVNAQQRKNLYVELQTDAEKNVVAMYPTPGLQTFVQLGAYPARGMYELGDFMYIVANNIFWRVANDGSVVNKGSLATFSGYVDISDNGNEIIVVDGPNGYIFDVLADTFTQIADPDFPGADTVAFINSRFVVNKPGTAEFYISGVYSGTTWDPLEFATAESDPDLLMRVTAESGQLVLFGSNTTEFWGDSGAADFPFARIGSSAIEWGLAARWSLCKFMDSLIFLRKNRLGQVQVCALQGYSAAPVTNPEMDYVFSQYAAVSDAIGFSYMVSGHPFYQITFPTPGETWLYDGLSKCWSQLESSGGRHRAELQVNFQNRSYVSDYETGKIYLLDENTYTDDGAYVAREFISRHQSTGEWSHISQLWLEMEAGTGLNLGQGQSPQIMMQISKDGGHEYGPEVWREIGAMGKYRQRAVFNRLGRARDWLFKFRITDPVKVVFVAAWGRVK